MIAEPDRHLLIGAEDLVDGVPIQEPSVEHGDGRLVRGDDRAVHIDPGLHGRGP